VTITTFEPTPTQAKALDRRRAFLASIRAKAVEQRPSRPRPVASKQEELAPKPLPSFQPTIVWPVIPDDTAAGLERPIARIQRVVASEFGISVQAMISERRTANIVLPRQIAMFLAKETTLRSLPEIGRRFGNRDHTTALHAVCKIRALIESDAKVATTIHRLKQALL
jgi:hypothetical protein